ncbi:MAG: AtpZ/AtpI family protein [Desulfobacteraceae bacterium]|nr:AtpZ/AtpI family protein [Desulfobacteraceae bacterium]
MSSNFKGYQGWAKHLTVIMQLGLTMAGCIGLCFYIGLKLDQLFNTKGIFITIFTLLGAAGGANVTYRQIMEIIEDKEHEKKND